MKLLILSEDIFKMEKIMNWIDFGIKDKVNNLSKEKLLLFAGINCEKLYPSYQKFTKVENTGDPELIEPALSLIFQSVFNHQLFSINEVNEIKNKIDIIIPELSDYESSLASFAVDFCSAIYDTLDFITDGDINKIVNTAIYALDTVDMFINMKEDLEYAQKDYEKIIANDVFMVSELKRQSMLIDKIKKLDKISDESINELRKVSLDPLVNFSLLTNI